jgi:hypothetical protein
MKPAAAPEDPLANQKRTISDAGILLLPEMCL